MNQLLQEIQTIVRAISSIRMPAMPCEYDIHTEISSALTAAGIPHSHEYKLAPRCRIDFLVDDLGIEIKKSRPNPAQLKRQLARYADCDAIASLLVIAPRGVNLPKTIGGKPVLQIGLERLWGISLP